jgi:hypothetical protein
MEGLFSTSETWLEIFTEKLCARRSAPPKPPTKSCSRNDVPRGKMTLKSPSSSDPGFPDLKFLLK